jgi:hypothetical protein
MSNRVIVMVPDGADMILQTIENYMLNWDYDNSALPSSNNLAAMATDTLLNTAPHDKIRSIVHTKHSFESHAYEALMTTVLDIEANEFRVVRDRAEKLLSGYTKHTITLSIDKQEEMQVIKEQLDKLGSRLVANKRAVTELLEDDERMALMNLTRLKLEPALYR